MKVGHSVLHAQHIQAHRTVYVSDYACQADQGEQGGGSSMGDNSAIEVWKKNLIWDNGMRHKHVIPREQT